MVTTAITTKNVDARKGEEMRYALVVLLGLLYWVSPAAAQVSIGIGLPGVSIGINMPSYPELAPVPDYPVYYAPRGDVNLFFYDGMYWAYQRDNWYASSWYNGPWRQVGPQAVPAFVLRIPVRYYRHPPAAWAGWQRNAPPRWGQQWGHEWEQHHQGWDQWDRHATQARAPLPVYQRQYSGSRYPREERQQQALHNQKYRYQPQDPVVRDHYQQHGAMPQPGERGQQANQRFSPPPPPHENAPAVSRPQPTVVQHEQPVPRMQGQQDRPQGKGQDRGERQQPQHGPEQGQEKGQEQEKGPGHGGQR
jgi:hypothetical protein